MAQADAPTATPEGEQLWNCEVCFHPFGPGEDATTCVPLLLQCGHSYCGGCLVAELARTGAVPNTLTCPRCREPTWLGEKGVAGLKRNFALLELIALRVQSPLSPASTASARPTASPASRCIECEGEATIGCSKCEATFCDGCYKSAHKLKALASHVALPLAEYQRSLQAAAAPAAAASSIPRCPEHDEPLKLFCCTDKVPICLLCREFGAHKGHEVQLVETVVAGLRRDLEAGVAALERWTADLRAASQAAGLVGDQVDKAAAVAAGAVEECFAALGRALHGRKTQLLAAVWAVKAAKRCALAEQVHTCLACSGRKLAKIHMLTPMSPHPHVSLCEWKEGCIFSLSLSLFVSLSLSLSLPCTLIYYTHSSIYKLSPICTNAQNSPPTLLSLPP
jgi:hypothetical protein